MRMHELDDHVDSRKNHRPEPSSGYDFKTLLRFVVVALLGNMIWSGTINALLYRLMGVVDSTLLIRMIEWLWIPNCLVMAWVYRRFVFKAHGRLLLGAASLVLARLVQSAIVWLLMITPAIRMGETAWQFLLSAIYLGAAYLLLSRLAYPAGDGDVGQEKEEDRAWMHLTNRDDQDQ
jgi:hypothetical protein